MPQARTIQIADGQVTAAKLAAGAIVARAVDGVNETTPTGYTVTGMTATSKILYVQTLTTKAAIGTQAIRQPASFTCIADGCTVALADRVDNTNNQLIFVFIP